MKILKGDKFQSKYQQQQQHFANGKNQQELHII